MKVKFSECVEYMIKGPFGSDMKKSLYVPKGEDTYKVYVQGNAIQKDESLGDYYVSSEYFHKKLKRFQVHPGDYLITCDGTLGKYIKLSENIEQGVISSSLLLLRLDESKIYDKFFELIWDNSMLKYLASQARNACLVHLPSAKAIGDVEIDLPEMSMQREIADKAFLIKDIVNKRNEEMGLLDELSKARFVELFGTSTPNDIDGENYVSVASVCSSMMIGPFGSALHKPEMSTSGEVFVLGTDNAVKNEFAVKEERFISSEKYSELTKYTVKSGDIIITMMGTIGRVAVIPDGFHKAIISSHLSCLTPDFNVIYPRFLHAVLTLDDGISLQIAQQKKGAIMSGLNLGIIKNLRFKMVDKDKQKVFLDFIEQVDKSKF